MSTTPDPLTALETRARLGDRLTSPSAERNKGVIADVLEAHLTERARVLEIGSGTGQHGYELIRRRPDVLWQPSDPDAQSRKSQDAWALDADGRILPSLALDLMQAGWSDGLGPFDAVVCMNVIHISPWDVCEQLAGRARDLLAPSGLLFLYGPFREGEQTAPSNMDFDRSLKARNPSWGVRDLDQVISEMANAGLSLHHRLQMPANNLSLIFKFAGDDHASS